jgi:hypothetical protein
MEWRTKYYRDRLHLYVGDEQWAASLKLLGTCAHIGSIEPEAITRVAFFDPSENPEWSWACMDPSISIINKKIKGYEYQYLNSLLFNEQDNFPEPETEKLLKKDMPAWVTAWDIQFDHSKVEVIVQMKGRDLS